MRRRVPGAGDLLDRLCAGPRDARPKPSAAIVVAHQDDEVVGAGARLAQLSRAAVLHVTDGAPRDMRDAAALGLSSREDYARVRQRELLAALACAGVAAERAFCIGCVDQEASLDMAGLAVELSARLRELEPDLVLTHAYEGGHPDHDATAFAVHAAIRLLEASGAPTPVILELSSYHARSARPPGRAAGDPAVPPPAADAVPPDLAVFDFLAPAAPALPSRVRTLILDEHERRLKQRMYDCYATQRRTLQWFPIAVERFRAAPAYDFSRPPHPGTVFYERLPWGMTARRWIEHARHAAHVLGLDPIL